MSVPLSVRRKIDRAKEHVGAYKEVHQDFIRASPYEAVLRILDAGPDGKGTQHAFFWKKFTEPPSELGLILGDAIHNIRSALDHLAFALAVHGAQAAGKVMTPQEETAIQFPITLNSIEFQRQIKRDRLKYVDSNAIAAIEGRQPYSPDVFPKPPSRSFIAIINRLDNTDKHRSLNFLATLTNTIRDNWPAEFNNVQLEHPPGPARMEVGAEIGRFTFPAPQSEVDVPLIFGFGLALAEAWPHSMSLPDLLSMYVDSIERMTIQPIADQFLP